MLKTFLILEVIKEKFNIRYNKPARMKVENSMMLLDLIILQKLLRISIFVFLINRNFKQKKMTKK